MSEGRFTLDFLRGLGAQHGAGPLDECGPMGGVQLEASTERDAAWREDPECKILYEARAGLSENGFCPQLTLRAVGPSESDGLWHLPLRTDAADQNGRGNESTFVEVVPGNNEEEGEGEAVGGGPSSRPHPRLRTLPHGHPKVVAGPLRHPVPSLGYVVEEASRRGNVQIEAVKPLLERNSEAIREQMGLKNPMVLVGRLRAGERVELPDGAVLDPEDPSHISPPVQGRKLAIFGDTCRVSPQLLRAARGCDLLVHEATNSLTSYDVAAGATGPDAERRVRTRTVQHGHSTARMAGELARAVGARTLLLNHLSSRYSSGRRGLAGMKEIVRAAVGGMGGVGDDGGRGPPHVDRLRALLRDVLRDECGEVGDVTSDVSAPGPGPGLGGDGGAQASRLLLGPEQSSSLPLDPTSGPHVVPLQGEEQGPATDHLPVAMEGRVVCAQDMQVLLLGRREERNGYDVEVEVGIDPGVAARLGTSGPTLGLDAVAVVGGGGPGLPGGRLPGGGGGAVAGRGKGKGKGRGKGKSRGLATAAATAASALSPSGTMARDGGAVTSEDGAGGRDGGERPGKRPRTTVGSTSSSSSAEGGAGRPRSGTGAVGVAGRLHLDHLVLTVADVHRTAAFYERVLGMEARTDGKGRTSLRFGVTSASGAAGASAAAALKLHPAGAPFQPHAARPVPGAIDLCFLVEQPVAELASRLRGAGVEPLRDPTTGHEVVRRTGASGGPIDSVYFRDPDGNLVELSNPAGVVTRSGPQAGRWAGSDSGAGAGAGSGELGGDGRHRQ